MEIEERLVDVGAVRLNVATAGPQDGPAVLLLHGFPDRWHLWRHQIPALVDAGFRVVAPDLRGFGESDKPGPVESYAFAELVGDVHGLLGALGIDRAHVVGHDFGAGLAWVVATHLADRVRSLTALSVGHGATRAAAGEEQRQRSWYMLWFQFPGVAEELVPADDWAFLRAWGWNGVAKGENEDAERQIADLARPGALTAALNWYRANIDPARYVLLAPPPAGKVQSVACPTLAVWSSADPFLGEAQLLASQEYVTGPWRYERLDGVDHWIPVSAPDALTALLLDFLPWH